MSCNPQDAEGWLFAAAKEDYVAACERGRISIILRPMLTVDGDKWCALYGSNIAEGVIGFGDSPDEAYHDFDKNWYAKLKIKGSPND